MKDTMLSAAKKTIGKTRSQRQNWISNDTLVLIGKKREAKAKSSEEYRRLRTEVQRMLRRDKQSELDKLCSELEDNAKKGNSRPLFQTVRKLSKPFQAKHIAIKNSAGEKLTEPDKVCQRWKEYCEQLYDGQEESTDFVVQEKEPPPLKEEIRRAILKSALRKAPGPDDIALELLRFGGEVTLNKLHEILRKFGRMGLGLKNGHSQSLFHSQRKEICSSAVTIGPLH